MQVSALQAALQRLKNGDARQLYDIDFLTECSLEATVLLEHSTTWTQEDLIKADTLLRISNIAYNCTSLDTLPLDDGVYDQLIVVYQKYNKNYQVGYTPVQFNEIPQNEFKQEKILCTYVNHDDDSKLFAHDIWQQHTPISMTRFANVNEDDDRDPIKRRLINTTHKYPELVGTLDKCKFVLNAEAIERDVFDKPSVAVFERDYIHMCLDRGIITPTEQFEMLGELKYDGVSVEAEVCGDTIVTALSRGDTADNVATDLTPIFGGYKFPFASEVPKETFGIKFEAVITKHDLDQLSMIRSKSYKNCRNAIIGLLGASDAHKYVDFITLIPIATSYDIPRKDELDFLNKYYHSGELNRHCLFYGNYQQILFQVKQFTESAEYIRPILPYMIDGVVISFTDPEKIKMLGRENSVNKYQMAIKFNPRSARTIFLGYTYNIGKSGEVIPMIHFKPCEFMGTIHTKQTIHSYERFKNLDMTVGEEIDVEYVNDVLTYITKPDTERNRNTPYNPVKFIDTCPYCGSRIVISESGKSAKCVNPDCHERRIMRMVYMLDKFGFKDFGEERVRALDLTKFTDLVDCAHFEILEPRIGPAMADQYIQYMVELTNASMFDWKFMSAMSFDGLADEKWKVIFKSTTLDDLIRAYTCSGLYGYLKSIGSISDKTIDTICDGFDIYAEEILAAKFILNIMGSNIMEDKPRVVLTGFRDSEFIDLVNANGFDCSDQYNVNKNTAYLVAADPKESSGKIDRAKKYGIPIVSRDEFLKINNIILQ